MNRILEAVIVEDEFDSLELLQKLINENGLARVTGSTSDPSKAVNLICTSNPDIMFLDIRMPGKNGFEILDDLLRIKTTPPYVVFTTAFDEYAIKAFDYAAFDYLLKPVEPKRLNETLLRCIENKQSGTRQGTARLLDSYKKLFFRNVSGVLIVDPAEVIYIQADGNYSVFHFSECKTETVTSLLHRVEKQLPDDSFFRVSRSGIINTRYLKKINTRLLHCVLVKNDREFRIEISRDRVKELIEKMKLQ